MACSFGFKPQKKQSHPMVAPTQYIFLTGYVPASADCEQLTITGQAVSAQHIIERSDKLHNKSARDALADENTLIFLICFELKLQSSLENSRV